MIHMMKEKLSIFLIMLSIPLSYGQSFIMSDSLYTDSDEKDILNINSIVEHYDSLISCHQETGFYYVAKLELVDSCRSYLIRRLDFMDIVFPPDSLIKITKKTFLYYYSFPPKDLLNLRYMTFLKKQFTEEILLYEGSNPSILFIFKNDEIVNVYSGEDIGQRLFRTLRNFYFDYDDRF